MRHTLRWGRYWRRMYRRIVPALMSVLLFAGCGEDGNHTGTYIQWVLGSGVLDTLVCDVEPFIGISVQGEVDVIVMKGDSCSAVYITDDNMISERAVKVIAGILHLELYLYDNYSPTMTKLIVTMPDLRSIVVDQQSRVTLNDSFSMDDQFLCSVKWMSKVTMDTLWAGSAKCTVDDESELTGTFLLADYLDLTVDNGVARLEGVTSDVRTTCKNGGIVSLLDFSTVDADVVAKKNALVQVWVSGVLNVTASERSKVFYRGNPATINVQKDSTCTVAPM